MLSFSKNQCFYFIFTKYFGLILGRATYNKLGQDDSLLENENDRMASSLASKVSKIKSVSFFGCIFNSNEDQRTKYIWKNLLFFKDKKSLNIWKE